MRSRDGRHSAAIIAFLALALAGCGGGGGSESAAPKPGSGDPKMPDSPVIDRQVACMVDAGWDVHRNWSGGIEGAEIPEEQNDQWQAASDKCAEQSGWNDTGNLSDAQTRELYAQEVEEHKCLTDLGIDSAEPPTEQTYLDTYQTKDWYFAMQPGLITLPQGQQPEIIAKCPPPTWVWNISGLQ